MVFGAGTLSLVTDRDVISTPGLSPVVGPLAFAVSAAAFAAALWPALRGQRPRYTSVIPVALATALVHLGALWLLAVVFGADLGAATSAVGTTATSWTAAVVAASAAIVGWAAIAVRRTGAQRPQWPWERETDDE